MADVAYKQEFDQEMEPKLAALKKPAPNVTLPDPSKDVKSSPSATMTLTSAPPGAAGPVTVYGAGGGAGDLIPHPRESLVQYLPPELAADEKTQKALAARAAGKAAQIADVLNAILPPKEYRDNDGQKIIQRVSHFPSSRNDVMKLQMKLDEKLQERQARENGICPVREELYSQCFDELIREVTLESAERGLLLLRVRDEVRMTIAAYQTLYQSSITFGMRKTLQAEQGNAELAAQIEALEADKAKLSASLADQKGLCEAIEKRITENKAATEKKMDEEKQFLKFQKEHLEQFLKQTSNS